MQALLDDILEVGTNTKLNGHFIGSIVYVHDDIIYQTSRAKELTVIDGQQQLTTLTLIYLVIYKLANELPALARGMKQFLNFMKPEKVSFKY